MKNVINEFLNNLFGTSSISLLADSDILVSIDVGMICEIAFISFCCIVIASIFIWFFHILFEKGCES